MSDKPSDEAMALMMIMLQSLDVKAMESLVAMSLMAIARSA